MGQRIFKKYSEAFKRKVVEEIEEKGISVCEAQKKYGITGAQTVYRWVRKYGKNHLIGKVIRVETVNEKNILKEKEKEIAELQKALARSELKVMKLEVDLEWVEEKYGIKVKKKSGGFEPKS